VREEVSPPRSKSTSPVLALITWAWKSANRGSAASAETEHVRRFLASEAVTGTGRSETGSAAGTFTLAPVFAAAMEAVATASGARVDAPIRTAPAPSSTATVTRTAARRLRGFDSSTREPYPPGL